MKQFQPLECRWLPFPGCVSLPLRIKHLRHVVKETHHTAHYEIIFSTTSCLKRYWTWWNITRLQVSHHRLIATCSRRSESPLWLIALTGLICFNFTFTAAQKSELLSATVLLYIKSYFSSLLKKKKKLHWGNLCHVMNSLCISPVFNTNEFPVMISLLFKMALVSYTPI